MLIVEKCNGNLNIDHKNITVICQRKATFFGRVLELRHLLLINQKNNFKKIFIRISSNAAIVAILSLMFKKRTIYYWQSGTTYELEVNMKFGIKKILWFFNTKLKTKFISRFVDYYVSGPESMLKYYNRKVGISKKKLLLLYNDIDTKRFFNLDRQSKVNLKIKMGFQENSFIFLIVHRLSPVRKTKFYLEFIAKYFHEFGKNTYLLIIGDGPDRKELENIIIKHELAKQIIFIGNKPNSIIMDYYKICDIFLNPSYTEGFPRVILEAMATGIPIIATDAGGTIDIFGPKQLPFVIDREKPILFIEKMKILFNDSHLRGTLSLENIKHVDKFSTSNVAKMYVRVLFNENSSS